MTGGAFVALVFVLSNLVDWLVSLISPLAYLPPAFTQNSGWRLKRLRRALLISVGAIALGTFIESVKSTGSSAFVVLIYS
jgi:hypothetical protein